MSQLLPKVQLKLIAVAISNSINKLIGVYCSCRNPPKSLEFYLKYYFENCRTNTKLIKDELDGNSISQLK